MSRIFISHSSKDNEFAQRIVGYLKSLGHTSIFLDFDPIAGIPPGRNWEKELYANLRNCQAIIVLISRRFSASQWCFAEITHARAFGKYIIPVKIENCTIPGILADIQVIDATVNLPEALAFLKQGLSQTEMDKPGWDTTRPPYPGLLAFQEKDAPIFFGRGNEVNELLTTLRQYKRFGGPNLLLILGASGSGKSSLVRAGLIPQLRKKHESWIIVGPFRPLQNPFEQLANAILNAFAELDSARDKEELYRLLLSDAQSSNEGGSILSDLLLALIELGANENLSLVIVCDQFEEVFTYDKAEAPEQESIQASFVAYLGRFLYSADERYLFLGTLRSDFLINYQQNAGLRELPVESYTVQFLNPQGLKDTITKPAALADVQLEDGLTEMLINDTGTSDALPLLAFTLRELWEQHGQGGKLKIDDYRNKLGALDGSVARVAELVLAKHVRATNKGKGVKSAGDDQHASQGQEEEQNLRNAFLAMVRIDDEGRFTKRLADVTELPAKVSNLLEKFVSARLLYVRGDGMDSKIEVAHEVLFRSWTRLAGWLEEDKAFLLWRKRLNAAIIEWKRMHNDDSALLRGPALGEALEWLQQQREQPSLLTAEEIKFIQAGDEKAQAEKRRAEQHRLELELKNTELEKALAYATEQTLQARSKALSATARQLLETDPTLALRLAEAACKITPSATKEAKLALLDIVRVKGAFYKTSFEGHTASINAVAFSPDGQWVVTGSGDKTVKLWNIDGELIKSFDASSHYVSSVAFSPEGKFVVTGGMKSVEPGLFRYVDAKEDNYKTVRLWNLDGTLMKSLEGHTASVWAVAVSPDGNGVLSGSADRKAILWKLSGEKAQTFEGHTGPVSAVAISGDGNYLLTGSDDKKAILWNLDGTIKQLFEAHTNYVFSVAFSPDGKTVLTGSGDKTAKLWTLNGQVIRSFEGHLGPVCSAVFSPNAKFVLTASSDKTVKIWNLEGDEIQSIEAHTDAVISAVFAPDGKSIITASADKTAKLWKLDGSLNRFFREHHKMVYAFELSANGDNILTAEQGPATRLFKVDGSAVQHFDDHKDTVFAASISPNEKFLVTGSADKTLKLWTIAGTVKQTFKGHKHHVRSVAFSPSGKLILSGSYDRTAKLWDLDGTLLATLKGHKEEVVSVTFSPDGKSILTGSADCTAKLWSVTGKIIKTLQSHTREIMSVTYSPDGNFILTGSGDGTAKIWNSEGTLLQTIEGHSDSIMSVAFSPNGKFILTGSADKTAKLWTLQGVLIQSLHWHTKTIITVAFTRDGKLLFTGSVDRKARFWTPIWELLDPSNTYVPTEEQAKEYEIQPGITWGELWQ